MKNQLPIEFENIPLPYPVISFAPGSLPFQKELRGRPGVYFLESKRGILYIGSAQNCIKRLTIHRGETHRILTGREAENKLNWSILIRVHVMLTPSFANLAIESAYIAIIRPLLNRRILGKGNTADALFVLNALRTS